MKEKLFDLHNGSLRLRCVMWGNEGRPPVVMLHGLRAYGHWFDEFANSAADHFHLFAPDQRGRAGSDWAKDGRYDTESYVADLAGLADALGLRQFAIIGHSMGGTNAINFAARYPERVSTLIIVDSAPELNPVGLQRIARETSAMPQSFTSLDDARGYIRTLHRRASPSSIETRLKWTITERDGRYVWRLDPAIFPLKPDSVEKSWHAVAACRCPTLIVRAAESDLVTSECAARMVAALPNGFGAEVPAAAHMVIEDNPDGFAKIATPFLIEHLTRTAV